MIGTILKERYCIESELGRGGMGQVYHASDLHSGESVAVKALNAEVLAREPELLARFIREGEALRRLNHPNIVRMIAAVEDHGQHYLVMEFVEGGSLQAVLASRKSLPASDVIKIALEVSDALSRAHHLGIIHRDLKPANVLIAKDGTPRLADFGIAHLENDQHLTQTGVLMGTVDYVSPEVCQGERPDERSDIWAFGVMLFEMLSGRLPFAGNSLTARLTAILTQPVPDLAQLLPDVSPALINLVNRMLEKDPQQRIHSVRLVGAELDDMLKGRQSLTPAPSQPAARNNLPTNLSKFIGREKEIAEVKLALSEYRLVTLNGSGGVGKTRLSLQVATELLNQFPGGTWFVELAPITDPALIPQTILTAAGMQAQQGRSMLDSLNDFLREKTSLIVLDNCEHLIEACARLADTLLNVAPNLKILASSREALGVKGEHAWHVPSLSIPDLKHLPATEQLSQYEAVRLFIDRAVQAQAHFTVTDENANAVAQICSRLDGIPLAIELAAARVKVLKAEQIAERLNDRFRLLTGGSRTALPRQQTLRALIDWSYDLLAESEKLLLRRLAVFLGGCTLEAAEQVCSHGQIQAEDVLDLLIHLVDKSLVVVDEHPGQLRYRMLETVRQYAREKLLESGEGERLHTQHLAYFLEFAEEAGPHLSRKEQLEWFYRLELEHDNLHAALEWAIESDRNDPPEAMLRLVNALGTFWHMRGDWIEGREWITRALAKEGQPRHTLNWAKALLSAVTFEDDGVKEKEIKLCDESLAIFREFGDKTGIAKALFLKGFRIRTSGDIPSSKPLLEESLKLFRELNDTYNVARLVYNLGYIASIEHGPSVARQYYEESLHLSRGVGDRRFTALSLMFLGDLAMNQGDFLAAHAYYEESLSLGRELGDRHGVTMYLGSLGNVALGQGDYLQADEYFDKSLAMAREIGSKFDIAYALQAKGKVAHFQGDYENALEPYTESLAVYREVDFKPGVAFSLFSLGEVARLQNKYTAALSFLIEGLAIAKEVNDRLAIVFLFEAFAALGAAQGQATRSVTLFGAAEVLRAAVQVVLYPVEQVEVDKNIAAIRAQLSEDEFNKAWAEGRAMTMEHAIEFALQEADR